MPDAAEVRRIQWVRLLPWIAGIAAFVIAARELVDGYGDLGIYLDAAREFRAGGVDLFRAREDSGPWPYPHVALLPFALLQLVGPDSFVRWTYCVLLGLGVTWILRDVIVAMRPFGELKWWQWVAFGVLFQRCLAQNLTHGQLSLFVAVLATRGVVQLQRGTDVRAGVSLGLAAALKLTPLLLLVALLPMRRVGAALSMTVTVAVAGFVVPWPFCGTAEHFRHLTDLWHMVTGSLAEASGVPIVEYYGGPSVRGTLDYLLQPKPLGETGRTTNIVHLGDGALAAIKIVWSAALGAVLLLWFRRSRLLPDPQRLAEQSAAVMLAISLF